MGLFSFDHLTSVINGQNLTQFAYNGLGNRLRQTINGAATTYQLDLNSPLPQILKDGTNTYLYGNGRIGEYGILDWAYHHLDALGSVRLLTNSVGNVRGSASYTPFGEVMGSTAGSIFGFAGEQTDDTGLQYLRARYYAPEQGRFLTVDPYAGRQAIPYSLHPYQYGYSNPLGYVDPSGLCVNVGGFGALAVSVVSCLGQAVSGVASTVGGVASTLGTLATAASPVGVAGNMYMGLESTLDIVAEYTEPFVASEVVDPCAGSSVCASSASGDTLSIAPILEPLGGFTEPTPLEPLEGFELPSLEFDPLGGFTEPFPLEPLGGLPEPPALPPLPPLVATDEEHALICTMSTSVADIAGNTSVHPIQQIMTQSIVLDLAEAMIEGTFDWDNMQDPIIILRANNGEFLLGGHHRFLAIQIAQMAGITIPEGVIEYQYLDGDWEHWYDWSDVNWSGF